MTHKFTQQTLDGGVMHYILLIADWVIALRKAKFSIQQTPAEIVGMVDFRGRKKNNP